MAKWPTYAVALGNHFRQSGHGWGGGHLRAVSRQVIPAVYNWLRKDRHNLCLVEHDGPGL